MNLKNALLREHSRAQMLLIAGYIGKSPERFGELISLFAESNYRLTQLAAWS